MYNPLCNDVSLGSPRGSDDKESTCNMGRPGFYPWVGKLPGEGMATHSSLLAWRIPGTEKSGGLQSMGSQSGTCLSDLTLLLHI